MLRSIVVLALLAGCDKPHPNCERAVNHLFALITAGPPESRPAADEQAAIDQVKRMSLEQCKKEGLSDAQRDCIVAAKSMMEREFLMCPALVAKQPTWILAPIGHPEVFDEVRKLEAPPVDVEKLEQPQAE